ncbi:MAG: hypothetical protein WC719_04225 [Patescibacteria group bacterium]|jgi:hypothetical protein
MSTKKRKPEQVFPEHEGKFFEEDFTPRANYDITSKENSESPSKADWQLKQGGHKHKDMLSIGAWSSFKGID